MSDYFTVLTNAGAAAIAATQPGGTLNISQMAISTGGANYNPTVASMRTQTQLIDEVKRYPIVALGPAIEENAYFIQGIVPVEDGGWTIKEVGWFLDDGTLFAVSKSPPVEKTMPNSGAGIEIPIKATFKITSDVNLAIVVDNSAVYVTREEFLAHNHDGLYELKGAVVNTWRGIDQTPRSGQTAVSISSDWAFKNVKAAVPANAKFTDTHRAITDSLTSTSSSTSASANAMRLTYNIAVNAQQVANAALPATATAVNSQKLNGYSLRDVIKKGVAHYYTATDITIDLNSDAMHHVITRWSSSNAVITLKNSLSEGGTVTVNNARTGSGMVTINSNDMVMWVGSEHSNSHHFNGRGKFEFTSYNGGSLMLTGAWEE